MNKEKNNKIDLKLPIIILKEGDAPIYILTNNFGLISKGGETFYKNMTIYDANNSYKIKQINGKERASFFQSIRFFQPMFLLKIELEKLEGKSLMEFKTILKEHIKKHPKYWIKRDNIDDLCNELNLVKSFQELCLFFK